LADARDQKAAEKVEVEKPRAVVPVVSSGMATMTSLELVDFINGQRGEGEAELRHDHFMAKVPKVIGEKDAPNFRGIYQDAYGREKPCYRFPKREACLMAMSYSYELQAKVFDRMTELEGGAAKPQHVIPQTLTEALRLKATTTCLQLFPLDTRTA
jgi:hypothetical protein